MEFEAFFSVLAYPFKVVWGQFAVSVGSRYYWPYILGGTSVALILMRGLKKHLTPSALTWRHWVGPSARVDLLMVVINPIMRVLVFAGLISAAAHFGQAMPLGRVAPSQALVWASALTLCLFVADDFVKFFAHWLMHRIPMMWSFHRVHHSAEVMTFVTADRQHFMEILFVTVPLVVTYTLINILFVLMTGIETVPIAMAGANVILVAFNFFAGAFRHAPFWVSFGPKVEQWLISPAMHQIHHSLRPEHFDKNMGSTLALWDRLFGTHHSPEGVHELAQGIGLGEEGAVLNTLGGAIIEPFGHAIKNITPVRSIRDKAV